MLLVSDPRVADVPVVDGGEPLLDLRGESRMLVDLRKCAGAGAWARVRDGAALRLLVAQDSLPDGLRLLVVEGHRPAALQQRCFDEHRSKVEQATRTGLPSSWTRRPASRWPRRASPLVRAARPST